MGENMSKIKVLVFDQNKLYKDALSHILKDKEKIKSVFSISQYKHVLPVLDKFSPDMVLINSFKIENEKLEQLVKGIKNKNDKISIFILKDEDILLGSNTDRYVDLTIPITKDHSYLYKMIKKYVNNNKEDTLAENITSYKFHNLTDREMDVMKLISKGMSNKDISKELLITERTVKNHVSKILTKLSVNDRTQALIKCLKKGIVELESN